MCKRNYDKMCVDYNKCLAARSWRIIILTKQAEKNIAQFVQSELVRPNRLRQAYELASLSSKHCEGMGW